MSLDDALDFLMQRNLFAIWIVSIDMKKAFDRACRACIFDVLRVHGINEPMITLLIELYAC